MAIKFGAQYAGEPKKAEVIEYAQRLESLGFDAMWCTDLAIGRDPLPILQTAGAVTNLDLGTSVLLLPFRDPTLLAKTIATMDNLLDGRLILGVGVGGERPAEFDAYGMDPRMRGRKANEVLNVMMKLWESENVSHQGRFFNVETTLDVRPVTKPHPRVWIGGRLGGQGASRDAGLRRLARYGDGWLPYLVGPEQYATGLERLEGYAQERGRDPKSFTHGCQTYIGIYPTHAEASEVAMAGAGRGYGLNEEQANRFFAFGTVEEVIQRLVEYVNAGAEYFCFQWACRREDVPGNLEILSKEVLPAVRERTQN